MRPLPGSDRANVGEAPQLQLIEAYGDGGFRISGVRHVGSVIVLPDATLPWRVTDPAKLTRKSLQQVFDADPVAEILLIGCGPGVAIVPESLRAPLRKAGIVAEPMDTGAACRTYNVLLAEERRVAAALIAVD